MRIMLTNDDGIRAPGLLAMYRALRELADQIFVVAPLTVQSATSHGVTFHQPLMIEEVEVEGSVGIAVDGRPADCVKLALSHLWPKHMGGRPDLVVSGMNAGANVGINVIYSGTVAAALEAAFLGVPSIATSMHIGRGRTLFDVGAQHAMRAIRLLLADDLPEAHTCLNINVPRCEAQGPTEEDAAGAPRSQSGLSRRPVSQRGLDEAYDPEAEMPVVVCPMNTHGLADRFEERQSPDGKTYFWSAASGFDFHCTDDDSDVDHMFRRHITVTPLRYDLTKHEVMGRWEKAVGGNGE